MLLKLINFFFKCDKIAAPHRAKSDLHQVQSMHFSLPRPNHHIPAIDKWLWQILEKNRHRKRYPRHRDDELLLVPRVGYCHWPIAIQKVPKIEKYETLQYWKIYHVTEFVHKSTIVYKLTLQWAELSSSPFGQSVTVSQINAVGMQNELLSHFHSPNLHVSIAVLHTMPTASSGTQSWTPHLRKKFNKFNKLNKFKGSTYFRRYKTAIISWIFLIDFYYRYWYKRC